MHAFVCRCAFFAFLFAAEIVRAGLAVGGLQPECQRDGTGCSKQLGEESVLQGYGDEAAWSTLLASGSRPGELTLGDIGPLRLRWQLFFAACAQRLLTSSVWQARPSLLGLHAQAGGELEPSLSGLRKAISQNEAFEIRYADLSAYETRGVWKSETLGPHSIDEFLKSSTVTVNHAQFLLPSVAGVAEACTEAFGLPCNVNVYSSPPGLATAVPPHTDTQDTLVLQLQGRKQWRIYLPPEKHNIEVDGKQGALELDPDALALEVTLSPGESAYVPLGAPHVTSTVLDQDGSAASGAAEGSVHLTVGVETNTVKLTSQDLLLCALLAGGISVDSKSYFNATRSRRDLRGSLPLGALASTRPPASHTDEAPAGGLVGGQSALGTHSSLRMLAKKLLAAYSPTPLDVSDDAIAKAVNLTVSHYKSVLSYTRKMLADAQYNLTKISAADRRHLHEKSSEKFKFGYRQLCASLGLGRLR